MLCYVCLPEGIWFDWDNYGIRLVRIGIEGANTIRESNMAGKSLITAEIGSHVSLPEGKTVVI